jgi:hypothetical protein
MDIRILVILLYQTIAHTHNAVGMLGNIFFVGY